MYLVCDRKQIVNHQKTLECKGKNTGQEENAETTNKTKKHRERENAKTVVGKNAEREGASETEKKNKKKCWCDLKV